MYRLATKHGERLKSLQASTADFSLKLWTKLLNTHADQVCNSSQWPAAIPYVVCSMIGYYSNS